VHGVTELTECVRTHMTRGFWKCRTRCEQVSSRSTTAIFCADVRRPYLEAGSVVLEVVGKKLAELLGTLHGRNASSAKVTGNPSIES
jgi:hypothetical protein